MRWSPRAPLEIHARIGPGDRLVLCCPPTGSGPASVRRRAGEARRHHLCSPRRRHGRQCAPGTLEQDSGAQASLMAVDNSTGDVLAMVGGRDYALSECNRATQSEWQTGSSSNLRLHRAIEDGRQAHRHHRRWAGQLRRLRPAQLRERLQGRDDPGQRLRRVAQRSRPQAGRPRWHSQGHRLGHRFGVTSNIPALCQLRSAQ